MKQMIIASDVFKVAPNGDITTPWSTVIASAGEQLVPGHILLDVDMLNYIYHQGALNVLYDDKITSAAVREEIKKRVEVTLEKLDKKRRGKRG